MKKKISALAASVVMACAALGFVGCGGNTHTLVKVEATDPTCVIDGYSEHYKCCDEGCNKLFSDAEGKNEITLESVTKKAPGHTAVGIGEAKDATCTESGITAGEKCSACGMLISEQQTVSAKGHHATKTDGTPATCETDGVLEHYECDDCGKIFADDTCEIEIKDATIKAFGHAYKEWEPAGNNKHKKVCENDSSHVVTVDCSYGKISDFTDGTGHYLTCSICGGTSEKRPHDLKYLIEGDKHWTECTTCEYVSDKVAHAPAKLEVQVVGEKLYGGRTISLSDLAVKSVCECGHEEELTAEQLTFADRALVDGQNELSVAFGEFVQSFTYDAPVEPSFALEIKGATFEDGTNTVQLKEGEKCTAAVTLTAGKTFVGYRLGTTVMDDLTEFVMPDKETTLYALYEEDMIHFAPANKAQSQFSAETYDHVVLDNGIIATRFIWSDDEGRLDMKYPHSGADTRTHKVNVSTPAHGSGSLMYLYIVNDGEKDITLVYQTENYGVRAEITIVAKAGETTRVPFVYSDDDAAHGTFSTADHRIALAEGQRQAGETITLDIYGRIVSTERNKITKITASLPYSQSTFLQEGDNIDIADLSVVANISGYNVSMYTGFTCNVQNGAQWTPDIKEIKVTFGEFESSIKLNSYDMWIHAALPNNPKLASPRGQECNWLTAEHITDGEKGVPSTRFTFKAGTTANSEAFVNPTDDKGASADYNTSMPQHTGGLRIVKLYVKNLSDAPIKYRAYWDNYGDIGGVDIDLAANASGVFDVVVDAKKSSGHDATTGCCINIKLLEAIGEADVSVEMYTLYKSYYDEISGISVNADGTQKTAFKVGEAFDAKGIRCSVSTGYGSEGNVRITNVTTDLDGRVFTEEDIGEHTVTVTWNGLTATYKINVTAAE